MTKFIQLPADYRLSGLITAYSNNQNGVKARDFQIKQSSSNTTTDVFGTKLIKEPEFFVSTEPQLVKLRKFMGHLLNGLTTVRRFEFIPDNPLAETRHIV